MSMIGNYLLIHEKDFQNIVSNNASIMPLLNKTKYHSDDYLNIGKSWDIIHYALCGEQSEGKSPYSYVVLGGKKINDEDVGYGPARYLTPSQVKEAYTAIKDITKNDWISKYDWDIILGDILYSNPNHNNSNPNNISNDTEYDYNEIKKSLEATILERSWDIFCKIKDLFAKAIDESKYLIFYVS